MQSLTQDQKKLGRSLPERVQAGNGSSSQPRVILPAKGHCQCVETFLVVTTGDMLLSFREQRSGIC